MTSSKRYDNSVEGKKEISEESLLKISKEVAIKFIEMGRITPSTFDESFKRIHKTIQESVRKDK